MHFHYETYQSWWWDFYLLWIHKASFPTWFSLVLETIWRFEEKRSKRRAVNTFVKIVFIFENDFDQWFRWVERIWICQKVKKNSLVLLETTKTFSGIFNNTAFFEKNKLPKNVLKLLHFVKDNQDSLFISKKYTHKI